MSSNNLSRSQAQIAFVERKKISHKYFTDREFICLDENNKMVDEDGNILDKMEFWLLRDTKLFDDGWFVIE